MRQDEQDGLIRPQGGRKSQAGNGAQQQGIAEISAVYRTQPPGPGTNPAGSMGQNEWFWVALVGGGEDRHTIPLDWRIYITLF